MRKLPLRREGSCLCCCKNCISNGVVAMDSITVTTTSHMMVSKAVRGCVGGEVARCQRDRTIQVGLEKSLEHEMACGRKVGGEG